MTLSKPALIAAAAIVLAVAIAWFGDIHPLNQKREKMLRDIAQKQAALADLRRLAANGHADDAPIDTLKIAPADFESRLAPAGEVNKVLEELWRIAEANSLQTRTIKSLATRRTARYVEQELELKLSGDFSGFYQFMLGFENMKRVARVNRMDVVRTSDGDGQVRVDMMLSVFFQPDNARKE